MLNIFFVTVYKGCFKDSKKRDLVVSKDFKKSLTPQICLSFCSSKTFQRPLMPVSRTRYNLQEQFEYHKKHIKQLQNELTKLESNNGASHLHIKDSEKFFDKDKYNYLQFEVS